jgi:hypothetical protein
MITEREKKSQAAIECDLSLSLEGNVLKASGLGTSLEQTVLVDYWQTKLCTNPGDAK